MVLMTKPISLPWFAASPSLDPLKAAAQRNSILLVPIREAKTSKLYPGITRKLFHVNRTACLARSIAIAAIQVEEINDEIIYQNAFSDFKFLIDSDDFDVGYGNVVQSLDEATLL